MADQFQYVKLPDGTYGKFAADASPEDMRAAVEKQFPTAYAPAPTSGPVPGGDTGDPITGNTELANKVSLWEGLKGAVKGAVSAPQDASHMLFPRGSFMDTPDIMNTEASNPDQMAGKVAEGALELGAGLPAIADAAPSTARAGRLLASVAQDAIHEPVALGRTVGPLGRVAELREAGSRTPTVVNKLLNRVQQGPMTYPQARDFYSNLAAPSMWERMTTSPTAKRAIGETLSGFRQDIGDAAANVGRGEDYKNALDEYRRASNVKKFLGGAAVAGGTAAAKGAGLGTAIHVLGKVGGQ